MKTIMFILLLCFATLSMSANASANYLFRKVFISTTSKVNDDSSTSTSKNKIKAKDLAYTCQKVYETDDDGNRLKNEDGTDKYRVFLIDSKGNKVSAETVEAQRKQINKAITSIATKAAIYTGLGALSDGKKGALVGLAASLGLSIDDITTIVKLKKDLNKQKKAIEAYKKSFDEEGNPTTAEIDAKALKDLNLSEEKAISESTEKIKAELSADSYKSAASNESIDALLEAATKI